MGNHQRLWTITTHLIQAFLTHPLWKEHHTHATGSRATDTSASSSLAPVTTTSAPLQHTELSSAGTGPTTANGPPTAAVPAASFKKASPPSPPDYSVAGWPPLDLSLSTRGHPLLFAPPASHPSSRTSAQPMRKLPRAPRGHARATTAPRSVPPLPTSPRTVTASGWSTVFAPEECLRTVPCPLWDRSGPSLRT